MGAVIWWRRLVLRWMILLAYGVLSSFATVLRTSTPVRCMWACALLDGVVARVWYRS
jgi:hypothetical protein